MRQPRGVAMLGRLRRSGSRQFAASILIIALMLQSVALAIATGRLVNNFAADPDWSAFANCHSGPASDNGEPAAPGGEPERLGVHCIFCLAGTAPALEAPLSNTAFQVLVLTIVPWTITAWRLPVRTVDANVRPRGPPRAA
jgi:hypothetical protein